MDSTVAYKAFDKDMKCRGFQYKVGETYTHEGTVEICEAGFHACLNPLDCLTYYDLIDTRFAEVLITGTISTKTGDSKVASEVLSITKELTLKEFIKVCHESLYFSGGASSGNSSKQVSSGDHSKHTAIGGKSVISSSGINSTASGVNGTWISLAYFNKEGCCIGFSTGCIGEEGLEEGVFYKADPDGKLVRA